MSTRVETSAIPQTLLNSPLMTFFTLFAAVVIGSSLLEFNELLFPPKLSSISFWALLPVYFVAIDAWFGVAAWSRHIPYTDKPILRIMIMLLVLGWIVILALMYIASKAHISLLSYMWGIVVLFASAYSIRITRLRLTKLAEPARIFVICNICALAAATAYTIWLFVYPPVPDVVNWVFVAIAFVILIGWRLELKVTHTWRPEEKH